MFDHVTIRVSDYAASKEFYSTVLAPLGIELQWAADEQCVCEWDDFSLGQASEEKPVTRRLHAGFVSPSREHADEFWRVGTAAGYESDGEPGPRPEYGPDYYGSFLLDPDGNSAEAVHHDSLRRGGWIDHLWIRVADVQASKRFYEQVAPYGGFRWQRDVDNRSQFVGDSGSFSVLDDGDPTEHVHVAFAAPDNATVDAFHRDLTEAGYRDNGGPGERPVYHEGYYGSFILDPDGNNVEIVNHNRAAA